MIKQVALVEDDDVIRANYADLLRQALIKLNQLQPGRPDYDPTPHMLEPDANTKQFPTLNLYTRENSFFGVLQHACGMRLLIDGTRYDEHFGADPECLGWVECVNPTN